MAIIARDPQVGQLVYPAFTPQKAGKIIAIEPGGIMRQATIKMANGKTYQVDARELRELGALYDEHRRKAENLADLIEKLKEV